MKREVYADRCQFTQKDGLWEVISTAARTVPHATIKKLADSMTRIFDAVKLYDAHVGK